MVYVDWMIKTKRLSSCSCDYGCPCEFMAPPTREICEGVEAAEISEGYFGDIRLDGVRFAGAYHWPGAVHKGGGKYLTIVDERTTEQQREALFTILDGKEQEPTTAFNIYGSTIEQAYDPIFAKIEFEWDIANRTGRFSVPGMLEGVYQPIRNPVTNAAFFSSIKLPQGFEYREAEMASSNMKSSGTITLEYENVYGFLTYVTYGPYGVIEEHSYPTKRG
jgi:hypothetical protein